jgi:hypothetical protein
VRSSNLTKTSSARSLMEEEKEPWSPVEEEEGRREREREHY